MGGSIAIEAPETGAAPPMDTLFDGAGEMREMCRACDWSSTSLGPTLKWPLSLRTTVATLMASRHPMFLWWGSELVQVYNDAYRPSFGTAGRHLAALGARGAEFWPEIWHIIGPQIAQVMSGGEATWHENQLVPIERNGSIEDVWWTYSFSPAFDDAGGVGGVLVVCQETTAHVLADRERDQLLEETAEAEARYRTLFNSLDEGFCVIEMLFDDGGRPVDYVFLESNQAFALQSGLSEVMGKRMRELAPDHEAHWFETYGRVATSGESVRFQARAEALGRWYDAYAFPAEPLDGRRVAVLFRDVTSTHRAAEERERLVHALGVERARLADAFQRAPTFLAVLRGPDHVFELVNDAYVRLAGERVYAGRPIREALPEVVDQGFVALLDGVLDTGEAFIGTEMQVNLARTPGAAPEQRFVDFIYLPISEPDGTRSGIIAHGTDVTEQVVARRRIETLYASEQLARTALQDALRVAETANRAKAEFLAVMSHELRTPLNAIGGYAELLEMGIRGPVTDEQRMDLRRVQTSQRHLLGLINEVLNYAKLETGTVQYSVVDVPMCEALSVAESLIAPQAQVKRITLKVAAANDTLTARADVEKLRQILVNLLSNAVKFTDPGGSIEMWCESKDADVEVSVRDSGQGIPVEKLSVIFDPFVQVRSDLTRPNEGTGLGLAISRDLARAMGGDLTVTSELGRGSTFTLNLPRSE